MLWSVLFLQAEVASRGQKINILELALGSDPIVQLTLAILLFFSIFSWTIILYKFFQIKKAHRSSGKFLETFENAPRLEEILTKRKGSEESPLYEIFLSGLRDILLIKQAKAKDPSYPAKLDLDHVRKRIQQSSDNETGRLEQFTPFLATTASACPFIGLFGTVWGILTAFWVLKEGSGSSSIQVVGPYIAEALIATAVGLAAAIPAVVFYNYFVTKIKALARDYEDFSLDLTRRIQHEYF